MEGNSFWDKNSETLFPSASSPFLCGFYFLTSFMCWIKSDNKNDNNANSFNRKIWGSIRTGRIKLRHQDILFHSTFGNECKNPFDYLSGHARSSHRRCSVKGVRRNFVKFTGKHLCQSLFITSTIVLLPCKSVDWFLYDRDLRHERVKELDKIVEEFANRCKFCRLFTQKTIKHTIETNKMKHLSIYLVHSVNIFI